MTHPRNEEIARRHFPEEVQSTGDENFPADPMANVDTSPLTDDDRQDAAELARLAIAGDLTTDSATGHTPDPMTRHNQMRQAQDRAGW